MNLIIDDEESVVMAVRELYELDFGILLVMLLQVGEKLLGITCVDGG